MVALDENDHSSLHVGAANVRRRLEPQRVMLILTKTDSVSDQLIDAVEREFPRVIVEQADHIGAAGVSFPHPVSLILVDVSLMKEAEAASDSIRRVHPNALIALIQPDDRALPLASLAESRLFRSILPMDLRLDIWLSIIRLMLCGGEYLPPDATMQARAASQAMNLSLTESMAPISPGRERLMTELTVRETQILEMAARGLQNKLIAAEFRLSEHTVKVHLHNIIRKLGVHNRTEAAARFRNSAAAMGFD